MISQIGKVVLENVKTVKVARKEEVDGEMKETEKDVSIRFDFAIPMGAPYDLVHEVLSDFEAEVTSMQETSKKQAEAVAKKDEPVAKEATEEN